MSHHDESDDGKDEEREDNSLCFERNKKEPKVSEVNEREWVAEATTKD